MAGSQPFEHTISTSVSGKKPTVDYTVYAVGIDDDRNFTDLFQKNFTTKQSAMPTVAITSLRTTDRDAIRTTLFSSISRRPMRT